MAINRRRSPSSKISSYKKLLGHKNEEKYAKLIYGNVVKGIQKGDVKDKFERLHSVKSGKKWQVFLYSYHRISKSLYLKILLSSLDAFSPKPEEYFADRIKCIEYKESYIKKNGREACKILTNDDTKKFLGKNIYIEAKELLSKSSYIICNQLKKDHFLRRFYDESFFNNNEVKFLSIKNEDKDEKEIFRVFHKEDVLDTLENLTFPAISKAGKVPEDFNVAGQKVLLRYNRQGKFKNIGELEIRNDSVKHYRQVRFNMYGKDVLSLLLKSINEKKTINGLSIYGRAINELEI